jgi:general secretion pathway protein K
MAGTAEQRPVQRKQRGIALVMVLWVLMLLGLVAAGFLRETRLSTGIARNALENAKAEALAEAGIQRAMLGLADSDVTAWRVDGTPYQFALGDGTVVVRIQDEGGKVDLNLAPPPLLQGLLQITGVEANAARNLLDAIVDFRDPDSNRLPGGAEDPEYAATGRDGGAKDAPFDAKEELLQVLGIDRALYDAIAPYVTVHSQRGRIDLTTAPVLLLQAVPNLTPQERERIMADRTSGEVLPTTRVNVVTVHVEATTAGGGRFIREAVMERGRGGRQPFSILDWRQEWARTPAPAATAP